MNNLVKVIFSIIFFLSVNFNSNAEENNINELTEDDINSIYEFATMASMGVIFHEIGHLIVDEFNVPIFNNEEDVADSFMAWSLIHIPDEYESYDDYEYWSKEPHKVIKGISDYYYYKILLGEDSHEIFGQKNAEYSDHATDNKRFFNIACFMKGANPEVFDSYITQRGLDYILEDKCDYNYWQMSDAWWKIFQGNGSGYSADDYEFWETEVSNYIQKIKLEFQNSDEIVYQYFEEYSKDTILYFLQNHVAQIKLRENYTLSFEMCEGEINAYYISSQNKILICYELVEEFMRVKDEILLLKELL